MSAAPARTRTLLLDAPTAASAAHSRGAATPDREELDLRRRSATIGVHVAA